MGGGALHTAWPSSIPELVTERLRLRAPLPRDAAALLAVLVDPEVTRYHNVRTLTTLAEPQALLARLEQRYAARDTIRWAIELVEHSAMIGTVGLLRLLRFNVEHGRPPRRRQGRFRQGGAQPAVPPPRLARAVLPGTLVIAGAEAGPTGQVPRTREDLSFAKTASDSFADDPCSCHERTTPGDWR